MNKKIVFLCRVFTTDASIAEIYIPYSDWTVVVYENKCYIFK